MSHRFSRLDRRSFLAATVATAAASIAPKTLAQPSAVSATLTLHAEKPGPTIPANFIGLSYETQQLTDPDFLSPKNTGLIAMFRALSASGVLRLGGNTSDVGWWKPTPSSRQPPLPEKVVIIPLRPDEQPFQKLAFSITPQAVTNLRAFLDATGWTCIYGINLGTSTAARAAEEAAFVAKTLGAKLEYFQVGNEPDIFYNRFRVKENWNADVFFNEWVASANAIRAAVPNAKFGLPDTSGNPTWYAKVADRLAALSPAERPTIAALSHHYYFGGPPANPKVNLDLLLKHSDRVDTLAKNIADASHSLSEKIGYAVPYRMTEGNTCYRGGKPGVSDVFGASLWAADYLLTLASLGYAGANLHGGSGKAVADSLGGTLPGELLMADPKAPHPRPFYTPIAEINSEYTAEPVFYGMKLAGFLAGTKLVSCELNAGGVNATAYAGDTGKGKRIVVINKDTTQDLRLKLAGMEAYYTAPLTAPSLTSTDVLLEGKKLPRAYATETKSVTLLKNGSATHPAGVMNDGTILVPHSSALLINAS